MNVLITGAAGGLGRALAVECADRGYNLFLTDVNGAGLEAIRQGILRQYGVSATVRQCDLTDDADVKAMLGDAESAGIRFDMLLNVAGIDYEGGFAERGYDKISAIIRLNIEATLRITHGVLERRNTDNRLIIVFVSSLASMYPIPLKATYAASKRFILDFSVALREEMRHKNCSVMALCPGGLPTTQDALDGIVSQGFWGYATTNRLEKVARNTIARALKGKKLYIPGAVNRVFSLLGRIPPRSLVAKLLYNRWVKAQRQWLKLT
jgi:short-subunit dehydrogenase